MNTFSKKEINLINKMIACYWEQNNITHEDNKEDMETCAELVKKLPIPYVVGRSVQLKALEELKDFAYDNCQPHNSDRLAEIMERL